MSTTDPKPGAPTEAAPAPAKKRYCTICGVREVEGTLMCDSCKDRLRQEAMGERSKGKHDADRAMRKHGVSPKDKA